MWYWRIIFVANGEVNTLLSEYGFCSPQEATKNYVDSFDVIASYLKFKGLEDVIEVSVVFITISGPNGQEH